MIIYIFIYFNDNTIKLHEVLKFWNGRNLDQWYNYDAIFEKVHVLKWDCKI